MTLREFLKRPSTVGFLAYAVFAAVAAGGAFWGAWSLDRTFIAPDAPCTYGVDHFATWWARVLERGPFVPHDLIRAIGSMYFWTELEYALAAFVAGLGVAYYLRGRGCSPLARYGAAAAYAFMGYNFTLFSAGHLGWFSFLYYGPFVFGLTDRCLRKGKTRNWILLGGTVAWGAAYQPDLWLMFTVLSIAYGIFALAREVRGGRSARAWLPRALAWTALAAATCLVTGGPQLRSAAVEQTAARDRQIAESSRAVVAGAATKESAEERYRFCTNWSLPPDEVLEFVWSGLNGESSDPRVSPNAPYRGRIGQQVVVPPGRRVRHPVTGETLGPGDVAWIPHRQHSLYFGLVTVAFAILGACAWRRERDAAFWCVALVACMLCAFGAFTPFYRLVYALPMGDYVRCPVKFVHLVEWCAAVLMGFGVDRARAWAAARFPKANPLWPTLVLAAMLLANGFDLAHVARRYCAIRDLAFQRAPNAAADEIVRVGGGSLELVLDPREGRDLLGESFGLRGVAVRAPQATGEAPARFAFTTLAKLRAGALAAAKWDLVGTYAVSGTTGVRAGSGPAAAYALVRFAGVPAPVPERRRIAWSWLSLASLAATAGVAAAGFSKLAKGRVFG